MFKLMDKKIVTILCYFFFCLTGPVLLRYNFNTCTVVKAQQSDQGLTWHYLHVDSFLLPMCENMKIIFLQENNFICIYYKIFELIFTISKSLLY